MTVSSTTVKNSYSGNGSNDTFVYGFKIFAESDLQVIIRSSTGTETTKTITTHYTVTGVGDASGGNVVFTEVDKIVEKNGVKIMGERNILNKFPTSSSSLYAKNVFNFVSNLYDKDNKKININLEDEIIAKTILK